MKLTPRRSLLYMPGANARALEKARSIDADCLIFDLEDAVAPDAKAAAREQVAAALNSGAYAGRELMVRVNGSDTPWAAEDIAALAALPMDALVLPKIESRDQLLNTIDLINRHGGEHLPLWIMTETPRGVLDADGVYGCSSRLAGVIMGTSDLAKELRLPHTPDRLGFLYLLSHCVTAARAHGLEIIDGVHLNFRDLDEFTRQCEQGRTLGFDGKSLIHPSQVDICNRVFAPDAETVDRAQRIITAWDEAKAAGEGVCVVDGRLIENLHIEEAARTLALAQAIAAKAAAHCG
ncbi:CoA ester lyase [Granulosicoccaceae sp. 1_MG-2023]|nr:CoA ester lyase [Granulosicoccaceae sp. 1_MG-2023]